MKVKATALQLAGVGASMWGSEGSTWGEIRDRKISLDVVGLLGNEMWGQQIWNDWKT